MRLVTRMAKGSLLLFLAGILSCTAVRRDRGDATPSPTRLFDLWQQEHVQKRHGQDPHLVVVVAISGGGYRAANFGLGALLQMETLKLRNTAGDETNLLREIDYLTTVSGGGFPGAVLAMYHLSGASERMSFKQYVESEHIQEKLRDNMETQTLLQVLKPAVMFGERTRGDAVQEFVDQEFFSRNAETDRDCFRQEVGESKTYTLGDLFPPSDASLPPCAPYWIANTTIYNNGQTLAFTPDALAMLGVEGYWHEEQRALPDAGVRDYDTFSRGVPLALGLRSSFNFPVLFPPTALAVKGGGKVYLLDGGLSDNLALYSALEILNHEYERSRYSRSINDESRVKDGGSPKLQRRLLIVIDAFNGSGSPSGNAELPSASSVLRDSLDYLGLAAHRYRTRADLTSEDARAMSVVEAASHDLDSGVVYLDLDSEASARDVDTRLSLDGEAQHELICAGRRQACGALASAGCVATECGRGSQVSWQKGKLSLFARARKEQYRVELGKPIEKNLNGLHRAVGAFRDDYFVSLERAIASERSRSTEKKLAGIVGRLGRAVAVQDQDIAVVQKWINQKVARVFELVNAAQKSKKGQWSTNVQELAEQVLISLGQARGALKEFAANAESAGLRESFSLAIEDANRRVEKASRKWSVDDEWQIALVGYLMSGQDVLNAERAWQSMIEERAMRLEEAGRLAGIAIEEAAVAIPWNEPVGASTSKALLELDVAMTDLAGDLFGIRLMSTPLEEKDVAGECSELSRLLDMGIIVQKEIVRLEDAVGRDMGVLGKHLDRTQIVSIEHENEDHLVEVGRLGTELVESLRRQWTEWPGLVTREKVLLSEWVASGDQSRAAPFDKPCNRLASGGAS